MELSKWFHEYFYYKSLPYNIFYTSGGEMIDIIELIQLIKKSSTNEQRIIKEIIKIVEVHNGDIIALLKDIARIIN